jgi:S1-C subfamily serine protease
MTKKVIILLDAFVLFLLTSCNDFIAFNPKGVAALPRPKILAIILDDIKFNDVIVSAVTGYAQSIGVPVNSKVIALDGVVIEDKNHLVELMYGYDSGDSATLKVQVSNDVYEEYTILL